MALELPILRIGLVGFSLDQQEQLHQLLGRENTTRLGWELAVVNEADVFLINGARTHLLADGTVRVGSGVPGGRAVQFSLSELDRPAAFARPLAPHGFNPELEFDPGSLRSLTAVLTRFESMLAPLIAQFCLASQVIEQESALGPAVYNVTSDEGGLVAVVNLRGEVAVRASASAEDFDDAMWTPQSREQDLVPEHFARTSLSRLMWQYALRTKRDVLPPRYRTDRLYFRRPPRLPQRAVSDAHLLLLRELAYAPATFDELQQHSGLVGDELARNLAALYLVGAITSNPKRAAQPPARPDTGPHSVPGGHATQSLPTSLAASFPASLQGGPRQQPRPDLTAPAPLNLE